LLYFISRLELLPGDLKVAQKEENSSCVQDLSVLAHNVKGFLQVDLLAS